MTGRVVDEVLADHVLAVLAALDELRAAPDAGLHEARLALRSFRATLAGFRDLLEPGLARGLAGELQWLGRELSPARDAQVARDLAGPALAGDRTDAAAEVLARLEELAAGTAGRAVAAVDSERSAELAARLQRLLIGRSGSDAFTPDPVLAAVRQGVVAVLAPIADLDSATDEQLHDVRKRAKRTRYQLRALLAALEKSPPGTRRVLDRLRELQEALGRHQDAVTTASLLRGLELQPPAAALAERLAAQQDAEAANVRTGLARVVRRLEKAAQRHGFAGD